jgi:hypothetical protein
VIVVRVIACLAGIGLVLVAVMSVLKTLVLPRAEVSTPTRALFVLLRRVFDLFTGPKRSFRFRDRVMAFYAPVGLLLLPVMWITLLLSGEMLIFWATGVEPLSEAFATSGSSLFTLGFVRPDGTGRIILCFIEAALGLAILSLMISYLPTIYGAFQRREALVGMLEVRAGCRRRLSSCSPATHESAGSTGSPTSCSPDGRAGSSTWRRATPRNRRSSSSARRNRSQLDHRCGMRARHRRTRGVHGRRGARRASGHHAALGLPLAAAHRRLLRHPLRRRPAAWRSDLGPARRVRRDVQRARGRGCTDRPRS